MFFYRTICIRPSRVQYSLHHRQILALCLAEMTKGGTALYMGALCWCRAKVVAPSLSFPSVLLGYRVWLRLLYTQLILRG